MSITISGSGAITGASTSYSFDQAVSIAGTVTYEDVSNVDSVGVITAQSGIHLDDSIIHLGDTNTKIRFPAADTITAETAGSERLRVGSDGNCSIGTTTNTNKLRVHQGSDSANIILATGADESSEFISLGIDSGVPTLTAGGVSSTSASLAFRTSDSGTESEKVRISSDGKLCVGINTPFGTENENVNISSGGGGRIALLRNDTSISSGNELGRITWYSNDSTTTTYQQCAAIRAIAAGEFADGDKPTDLVFLTTPDNSSTPAERLRIHSDGEVEVNSAGAGQTTLSVEALYTSSGSVNIQTWARDGAAVKAAIKYVDSDTMMKFGTVTNQNFGLITNDAERMRIDNSGNALFSTTTNGTTAKGIVLRTTGELLVSRQAGPPLLVNRLTNDGSLVDFRGQNSSEGSISVSGSTVSYNGGHLARWSQLAGGAERTEILRGSVLSNLDEMCEWGEEDNEQLNRMKVSDVEGDVNVSGVFQCWDDDDDTYTNDFYCAVTGDFVIRIAQGVTVARGDLLMSAGDGTAKPQGDGYIQDKTIAKVTSTTVSATYSDGSYCVPCVLMAC